MSTLATPPNSPYQFAALVQHTSMLTGQQVYANLDPVQYGIRPALSDAALRDRLAPQHELLQRMFEKRIDALSPRSRVRAAVRAGLASATRAVLVAPFEASTLKQFAVAFAAFDRLQRDFVSGPAVALAQYYSPDEIGLLGSHSEAERLSWQVLRRHNEALSALWLGGIIAAPPRFFEKDGLGPGSRGADERGVNLAHMIEQQAFALDVSKAPYSKSMFATIHRRLLLSLLDVKSARDLDLALLERLYRIADPPGAERHDYARRTAGPLAKLYAAAHAANDQSASTRDESARKYRETSRRMMKRAQLRTPPGKDPTFAWADSLPPHVQQWTTMCRQHLATDAVSLHLEDRIVTGRRVLNLVAADTTMPPPHELCLPDGFDRARALQTAFIDKTSETTRARYAQLLRDLFDTAVAMSPRLADGTQDGRYKNPFATRELTVVDRRGASRLSTKIPLPQRFVRLATEVITAADSAGTPFAWPRTLAPDYFVPTPGAPAVWSPVRSHLLLLRLLVPIRSFQARMLDSGFGDYWRFNSATAQWEVNRGPHAPSREGERPSRGLLKRMMDTMTGSHFNGLHITTNKTADREAAFANPGYDIPYAPAEVVELFCRVRDFQEQYAVDQGPITRDDVKRVNPNLKSKLVPIYPLFRDLASATRPDLPPTQGRLTEFWADLLAEVEQRLERDGVRNDDGSPVRLTRKRKDGARLPIYTGHSLRLSGVQRLLMAGLPLEVVSAIVGHSSVVMTLMYYKPSAAYIQDKLEEAEQRLLDAERREFEALLRNPASQDLAREMIVANNDFASDLLIRGPSAGWGALEAFLCPNGETMCDEGGPLLKASGGRQKFGPVPGGARNCALCRFACTTPAHLPALVAHWNALSGRVRMMDQQLEAKEARRRELEKTIQERRARGEVPSVHRRAQLDSDIERLQEDVAILGETLLATTKLIARVVERLKTWEAARAARTGTESAPKFPLMLNGPLSGISVALEKVHDLELWDRICRDSEVYASVDASIPAEKRARLMDKLLHASGAAPLTLDIADSDLVAFGNAAVEWLRLRLGNDGWRRTLQGDAPLDAGLIDELRDHLAVHCEPVAALTMPHHPVSLPPTQRALPADHGRTVALPDMTVSTHPEPFDG